MILVDSSIWIDFFNGMESKKTYLFESILKNDEVIIGDLILTEVLQGFRYDKDMRKAQQLFAGLILYNMLGKDMAIQSAKNYRTLRKKGITVRRTIDVMIATFCIEKKISILHNDVDFDQIAKVLPLSVVI